MSAADHLLGALLCAAYVTLLWHTEAAVGMSRDEGIYVEAAQSYGKWLQLLVDSPAVALAQPALDCAFAVNHEHPPLMKLGFSLGHLAQQHLQVFPRESLSFRFAGMVSAGLLLWLIHIFGTYLYSRRAGLLAALAFSLLPRPFYHAHLCAFDIPITLATTAVTYAYLRSLLDRRWATVAGLGFGLALLTKHNSWLLPGIFAVHFAFVVLAERRARKLGAGPLLTLVPYWLLAFVVLGPLLLVLGWPWLWHETLPRLRAYGAFHLHHEYYNLEFFGENYFWPPFPWSYPWVLVLFTVPLTTLVLAVTGLGAELRRTVLQLTRRARASAAGEGAAARDPTQATVLLLGCLLAPLVLISLPSTPIFGGTKHWFPAYPFLALFAGRAFDALLTTLCAALPAGLARARGMLCALCAALLLAPAAVETAHSHPFALSHYTVAAGGVPGAADLGMNRQFWGFTTRSVVPFLRRALPDGGTIYLCDTIHTAFELLVRDGLLPANVRPVADISRADFALVHHELHFGEVDHQIWTTYGSVEPAYVLRYDGVPIVSVYENPKHAQRRRPR